MNDLKSENEKPKTKMKDLYEYQTDSEFVENKLLELEDLSKRFNLRTHQVIEAWYGTWEKCEKHLETLFEYKLGKEENIKRLLREHAEQMYRLNVEEANQNYIP